MGDEVIGDVSALHYSAGIDTPKNADVRQGLSRQVRQGAVATIRRTTTRPRRWIDEVDQEDRRQIPGAGGVHQEHGEHQDRCAARPGRASTRCATRSQNIYIKKVEKKKMFGYDKDELWNTVIKTYPNVSQFGQFKQGRSSWRTPVYEPRLSALQVLRTSQLRRGSHGPRRFSRSRAHA